MTKLQQPLLGKFYKASNTCDSERCRIIIKSSNSTEDCFVFDEDTILLDNTYNSISISSYIISNDYITLSKKWFDQHNTGDILLIKNGVTQVLFHADSNQNALFVTSRCNCKCLMCPQPPLAINDIDYWQSINLKLLDLIPKNTKYLGITGGEPTLLGPSLVELLHKVVSFLPETDVDILTNGRAFAWKNNIHRLNQLDLSRITFGVSLHSDYNSLHNFICQSKDSFDQTILGLHNLARYNNRVEIRVVLSKLTTTRLKQLSRYIYNNLPFVEHVAFMGLEYIGHTPCNDEMLWIDPRNYSDKLVDAVEYLAINDINVSIYNLPYCVLPESLRKYSRQSISDWKKVYIEKCATCSLLDTCSGVFASSKMKMSCAIEPIK